MYLSTADPVKQAETLDCFLPEPRETTPLNRYRIEYRNIDIDLPNLSPVMDCVLTACDAEHARERFEEALDADGWEILSVTREPKRGGVR